MGKQSLMLLEDTVKVVPTIFSSCYWPVALLFELLVHISRQFVQKQNFSRSACTHRELLDF